MFLTSCEGISTKKSIISLLTCRWCLVGGVMKSVSSNAAVYYIIYIQGWAWIIKHGLNVDDNHR